MSETSPITITFSGALGLKDAVRLCAELLAAFEGHSAVAVDCTELSEADVAIAQLLVAAGKTATASGRPLTLTAGKNGVLRNLFVKLGLLGTDDRPLVPDIDFWISAQGKAA